MDVRNVPVKKAENKRERLGLDIVSSPSKSSIDRSSHWLCVLDEATDPSWSFFLKEKTNLGTEVLQLIKGLKEKGLVQVRHIRCDNASKNRSLKQIYKPEAQAHLNKMDMLSVSLQYVMNG